MNIFKRNGANDNLRRRQPQGVPSGGQFAAESKPEAGSVILGPTGSDRTQALIHEAGKVYSDPEKAVNAAMAIEVMEETELQVALAVGCQARGNVKEAEAHRTVSTLLAELPVQIQGAGDAWTAAETIGLFRTRLADGFRAEGHSDDRALRRADGRLEYLQRYIEHKDRIRTGATEAFDFDYGVREQGRWGAAQADQLRGRPVTVGRRTGLTPEDARAAMAANAIADLRFDLLSDARAGWPVSAMHTDSADAIRHLPEEIEQAGSREDRIAAVQGARERIHAVQEEHSALSSVTQDVRNHLDEADRLLGKTYDWDRAGC